MPIENRNLTKGIKLTGRYHKQSYSCEVVEDAEGKLRYRAGGWPGIQESSAAGMAITGHSCDGWKFWSLQTEETAPAENQQPRRTALRNQRRNLLRMLPRPTPRKPGYFWCRIRRVCRKDRSAGSAGTAARASSPRQSKCRGFAPTIRPTKTAEKGIT